MIGEVPMRRRAWFDTAVLATLLMLAGSILPGADAYRVIKRIPIAGDKGWDYITADSAGRRLYLPHRTEVIVLDLDSGAIDGEISGFEVAHLVAVARELGRGFDDRIDPC